MAKVTAASRNHSKPDLLQPAMLARLSNLELVAKTVVDGYFTGMHRSPFFGFSQEFAEYRSYNDGDDPRFIDWNVFARTDRTYIKRYLGETNTAINLVLDVSGSMSFKTDEVSKLTYGKFICASLAYLARRQHDALGATLFDDTIREVLPPASHPDTFYRLLALLERTEANEGTGINNSLEQLAGTITRRGLILLISDLYCDPEELTRHLQILVNAGHEVVIFHVLDRSEHNPADHIKKMRAPSNLRDIETGAEVQVSADFLRDDYPLRIAQHIAELERTALRNGIAYIPCNTSAPLNDLLHQYLLQRQQRR
ncbi:hypothetical protein AB833_14575 [Chromatiales bacterium (ex Bugula neritina AB1)]|nr:hypothetical protein AB833_14575 [Chromatiales bacterium (ex Bugula neritina AB1)]